MLYLILIIIIILLAINTFLNKFTIADKNDNNNNYNNDSYERKEYLMTKNELKFYKQLKKLPIN